MDSQVHAIDVSVQKQCLVNIEWETFHDISAIFLRGGPDDLLSNSSGKNLIAVSRGCWVYEFVQRENLFEIVFDPLGLWIDDDSGNGGEPDSGNILIKIKVLLLVFSYDSLLDCVPD